MTLNKRCLGGNPMSFIIIDVIYYIRINYVYTTYVCMDYVDEWENFWQV